MFKSIGLAVSRCVVSEDRPRGDWLVRFGLPCGGKTVWKYRRISNEEHKVDLAGALLGAAVGLARGMGAAPASPVKAATAQAPPLPLTPAPAPAPAPTFVSPVRDSTARATAAAKGRAAHHHTHKKKTNNPNGRRASQVASDRQFSFIERRSGRYMRKAKRNTKKRNATRKLARFNIKVRFLTALSN